MNRLLLILGCLLSMLVLTPISYAVEILKWQRLPLAVSLAIGHERVIFIDRNIRVGVPASVGNRLRVQSAGGAIYLLANAPIESTRLQLQDADNGTLILIDITAAPGEAPLESVRIVETDTPAKPLKATNTPARETPIPVVLTRYAAQILYAPLRTVEPVKGISRGNLPPDLALESLLPTLPVDTRALAAWRLEDHWVTAVQLTNTSTRWIDLDPRALQGDFIAATFQHPNLGPKGDSLDTTVVYLVTRGHGLRESLLPTISPVDAALNLPTSSASGNVKGADNAK